MKRWIVTALLMTTYAYSDRKPVDPAFYEAVIATRDMVGDQRVRQLMQGSDLQILNVTWEDTGRYQNSAVGPNISDMTIQVAVDTERGQEVHCMPVIRFPNFTDKTTDVDPDQFFLNVGNEKGEALRRITLTEFLQRPTLYLSDPGSWTGDIERSLYASKRDSRVLVSAQACFLPVPKQGEATFNPVLFNYQSMQKDPAVLTVLVTPEGTSTTIIDNTRDAFAAGSSWGQRLFFNKNGERASLTGSRQSDAPSERPTTETASTVPTETLEAETPVNQVLLIQIPLKQKNPMRFAAGDECVLFCAEAPAAMELEESDVENAVISHGEIEGPFTEIDQLAIERDDRFPVRVTVQFYKATSNGVLAEKDLDAIKVEIASVYEKGDVIRSLVVDPDPDRITEYDGPKVQPKDWWVQFWKRHEADTGDSENVARAKLRRLLGPGYRDLPVDAPFLQTTLKSYETPENRRVVARKEEPKEEKKSFWQKVFGE